MPTVTVRNLPEETHRALRARAAHHGRSTEAEIRAILEETVRPSRRLKIGSEIHRIAGEIGNMDDLEVSRVRSQIRGAEIIPFTAEWRNATSEPSLRVKQ